jgi:hypothetical protein
VIRSQLLEERDMLAVAAEIAEVAVLGDDERDPPAWHREKPSSLAARLSGAA